jgi:hypothetical protein
MTNAAVVDAQPMPAVELGADADGIFLLGPDADDIFRGHARVVVTQAGKQFEMKGSEVDAFSVAPEAAPHEPFLFLRETSEENWRLWCTCCHAYELRARGDAAGPVLLEMSKPWHWCSSPWPVFTHPLVCACAAIATACLAEPAVAEVADGDGALGIVRDDPRLWMRCEGAVYAVSADGSDAFALGPKGLWRMAWCCCLERSTVSARDALGGAGGEVARLPVTCCEHLAKKSRVLVDFGDVRDARRRTGKLLFASALLFQRNFWDRQ